jgi:hypothetical protein
MFSVIKTYPRRSKQKVLPSAEKLPQSSNWCGRVSLINPGAKIRGVDPGGVCPMYGPLTKGFANTGMELIPRKTMSTTIFFFVCFIAYLLFIVAICLFDIPSGYL